LRDITITDRVNNNLAEIERARGFPEAAELKSGWISGMQDRALILESHHSTHIEGTELTPDQGGENPFRREGLGREC
jgi:hypothetical protein